MALKQPAYKNFPILLLQNKEREDQSRKVRSELFLLDEPSSSRKWSLAFKQLQARSRLFAKKPKIDLLKKQERKKKRVKEEISSLEKCQGQKITFDFSAKSLFFTESNLVLGIFAERSAKQIFEN